MKTEGQNGAERSDKLEPLVRHDKPWYSGQFWYVASIERIGIGPNSAMPKHVGVGDSRIEAVEDLVHQVKSNARCEPRTK